MSNPRVPPRQAPYSPQVEKSFQVIMPPGIPPLNIFRTLAHNERVLARVVQGGLLDRGSISVAQRELVILRACALCGAEYEWGVHVTAYHHQAGFNAAQIANTCASAITNSLWNEEQRSLLRMVDELHADATISSTTWQQLRTLFSDEQLIELVMLAGQYHAISFLVNSLQVENEAFAARFPASTP